MEHHLDSVIAQIRSCGGLAVGGSWDALLRLASDPESLRQHLRQSVPLLDALSWGAKISQPDSRGGPTWIDLLHAPVYTHATTHVGVCGWTTVLHYDVWAVTIVLSVCGLFVCVCSIDPRVFGV